MDAGPSSASRRLFVAIEIPEGPATLIRKLQSTLRTELPAGSVRWTRTEPPHVTLRFFGPTPGHQLPGLAATLRDACARQGAFELRLGGLGWFPDRGSPRVIWLGVQGELEKLLELRTSVLGATTAYGNPDAGIPFRPHATLGRTRMTGAAMETFKSLARTLPIRQSEPWKVTDLLLLESPLGSGIPRYARIEKIPLQPDSRRGSGGNSDL